MTKEPRGTSPPNPTPAAPARWAVLRRLLGRQRPSGASVPGEGGHSRQQVQYGRFQQILAHNDKTLELIADVEDAAAGRGGADLDSLARRLRVACEDVTCMVESLDAISGGRHATLRAVAQDLADQIDSALPMARRPAGPLVLPLHGVRATDRRRVGGKMASLGEAWWSLVGVEVPPGFVVTTAGFTELLTHNDLWDAVDHLESLATRDPRGLEVAAEEVVARIGAAELPNRLRDGIEAHLRALALGPKDTLAVRSSAVGEDHAASHAGQYHTALHVPPDQVAEAYRAVVASAYRPQALRYRARHRLPPAEGAMAVGCQLMVDARCSGILLTRDPHEPGTDRVVLSVTPGIAEALAAGEIGAEELALEGPELLPRPSAHLRAEEQSSLARISRLAERVFRRPLDIEWALDRTGAPYLLQARPLVTSPRITGPPPQRAPEARRVLSGGLAACRGAASGPVYHLLDAEDAPEPPRGVVLVTRRASRSLSDALPEVAAIVTEIGSPTGHLAILAREAGVPCVVGLAGACTALRPGQVVTVDAFEGSVYDGAQETSPGFGELPTAEASATASLPDRLGAPMRRDPPARAPAAVLEQIAPLVVPLHLRDPRAPTFRAEGCRSLHDVVRLVHESVFEEMFHFGDRTLASGTPGVRLDAPLPIVVLLYDLGGALDPTAVSGGRVSPEGLVAAPLRAFVEGLRDRRVRWDQPRPLSGRGFLSVLGESMAGPPPEAVGVGRPSYAVASDRYLNFSTKAGYHFSTVDGYCGPALNMNYIQFRFTGGGAAEVRRARRVRFIRQVLTALEFRVETRGDALVARLAKYDEVAILDRLRRLGLLTLVTRQLDMLMSSDRSPDEYAEAFLAERLDAF